MDFLSNYTSWVEYESLIESTAEVLDDMSKCLLIDEFLGEFSVRYSRRWGTESRTWAEKAVIWTVRVKKGAQP